MAVIIAESTLALLDRMTADLVACRDPWARHWLVLPGTGRSEWVLRHWSRRAGVAGRSQVVPLRSVIEQAATAGSEAFSRDRLVLAIAQALATLGSRVPLAAGADCTVVNAQVLAWSQQLADAIDLALLCREGDRRWKNAAFLAELCEHPCVKASLAAHLGTFDRQEFRAAVLRWLEQWKHRGGIPRLWIQLDAGLPRVLMRCLSDLAELATDRVHLSLWSPSLAFWGDLRVRRKWAEQADAGPVLTHFGRHAQDLHNQSIDYFLSEGTGGEELPSADARGSLLGLVQGACRRAHAAVDKPLLEAADWSLTIHACRSPLRELEICRDRILQAMAEDSTLHFDDVLVLLTDPLTYAPMAGAALAPLPVRLLGLGRALVSPVASGLLRLLEALDGRLGLADIQSLLDEPLIAERFGFGGITTELLEWLEQAQFRWGIDDGHRAELQGDGERRWSLAFALRRLALGAISPAGAAPDITDDDLPLERATGLGTAHLAALARFAALLYRARAAWVGADRQRGRSAARPMREWCALLTTWCTDFLGDAEGAVSEQRTQLMNTLIPNLQNAAPEGLLVSSGALSRLVECALESLSAAQGSNSGGVTVADLHHYAGTPARMVLVAGLGSETFPHHEDRPAWHPLVVGRELGDPDRREADRHALLLALLSASDRVVLAYQGGSDEDGRERPPSTPIADLLAAVDELATLPGAASVAKNILIRHGLNGFSPSACAADTRPVERSYAPSDYAGAAALVHSERDEYPGLWSQSLAPIAQTEPLTLRDLNDTLQEPCRVFVRRLGLHVLEDAPELSQADALKSDPLARWSLRDRLLHCRLTGGDEERLGEHLRVSGERPRGQYGDALWLQSLADLPSLDERNATPLTEPLQIELDGRLLNATLPDGWYRSRDGTVTYCSASGRSRKKSLTLTISLLCLAAATGLERADTWFRRERKAQVFHAPEPRRAAALLAELRRLHELAECVSLPFWPETYDRMRSLEENLKQGPAAIDPAVLLTAGWSTWLQGQGYGRITTPESLLPATRLCFRGLDDPFTWRPALEVEWLAPADAPLAWRLYRFVSRWEAAARGAT
jgi:exonuclease V gamma subunit